MKKAPGGNPGGIFSDPGGGARPGKRSNQGVVGKVGSKSYAPPAEKAVNRAETTPSSSSPSTYGQSWKLTSANPGPSGVQQSTSDNAYAKALIATDTSNRRLDRSGKFFN